MQLSLVRQGFAPVQLCLRSSSLSPVDSMVGDDPSLKVLGDDFLSLEKYN